MRVKKSQMKKTDRAHQAMKRLERIEKKISRFNERPVLRPCRERDNWLSTSSLLQMMDKGNQS